MHIIKCSKICAFFLGLQDELQLQLQLIIEHEWEWILSGDLVSPQFCNNIEPHEITDFMSNQNFTNNTKYTCQFYLHVYGCLFGFKGVKSEYQITRATSHIGFR